MMTTNAPMATAFRVAKLSQNSETPFELRPAPEELALIAQELELLELRKLRFAGHIRAHGDADWLLSAEIGATVVQPCSVTLQPVTSRIDTKVERLFLRQIELPDDEEEIEMNEDERIEPLGQWIDVQATMIEALSLAVPEYPRKEDAELGESIFTEPGVAAMTDEAARPFAGLEALKGKLERKDTD